MSVVLTEQELKTIAEELKVDFSEAKIMYERALASGSMFSAKEFSEALKATNLGGAIVTRDDDEDEDEEKEKESLKDIVAGLAKEEFTELAALIEEQSKARDYAGGKKTKTGGGKKTKRTVVAADEDEEDEEEDEVGMKKKDFDALSEMVAQQTKAIGDLAQALVGTQERTDLGTSVQDFLSQLPRQQAAGFVSGKTKEDQAKVEIPDDSSIQAQLKEIQDTLKAQQGGGKEFYNNFTSRELNKGRAQ